jgi:transcriptional regulator with XRE-family HTH domain
VDPDTSRRELALFLRSRRERITPADVGLPAGTHRRAPGLRREEVAVLAGLSPTWYTYLEQGRDIYPSGEVLDSLARVLGLTEDERRYMHLLARHHVLKPRPLVSDLTAEEIVRQLVQTAENSPYPTYGVNIYCDLIAWNRAATTYYTDFSRLPGDPPNMLRWMLSAEARERILDWTDDTRDVVARWRAMIANRTDDRMRALVDEFDGTSPEFSRWWADHDVQEHRSRVRRFQHPRLGQHDMRLIVVQAPEFTPCVVVFHFPLGGEPKT